LAILTSWQDLRIDGDQEIMFIILRALSPRHDGTGTNKQCPGNHQMKGRGVGSRECTLWRGRGAHFGGEGREIEALPLEVRGSGSGMDMGWPKF